MRRQLLQDEMLPPFTELIWAEDGFKGVKRDTTKDMQKYEPLIFEDCFVKANGPTRLLSKLDLLQDPALMAIADPGAGVTVYKGFHLFVLVHGFHGNSFDVRNFKNVISVALPDALILSSEANEENSDQDLSVLGSKLSKEVLTYIEENCPGSSLGRLSFIGHSLGGLIVRAALKHLMHLRDKFHGFLSLCTPHLGCLYHDNKWLGAGMWVLKTFKSSKVIA